jgi:basic membrane lipoprotein Med (substrate-binding protein (PBP1-ABC) superfamily)
LFKLSFIYRKLIFLLLSFFSFLFFLINSHNQKEKVKKIYYIAATGALKDKSFNQIAYEGIEDFIKLWNNLKVNKNNTKNQYQINYLIVNSSSYSELIKFYDLANYDGAEIVVLNGFFHKYALETVIKKKLYNHKVKFILNDQNIDFDNLDIGVNDEDKEKLKNNYAFITYKSQESGFFAGLYAWIWALKNEKLTKLKELNASAFGGFEVQPIVSYMYGFRQGIEIMNKISEKYQEKCMNNFDNNNFCSFAKSINEKFFSTKEDNFPIDRKINFIKINSQFSGSFDAGRGKSISEELINDNKINILFPVAGSQTNDALSIIKAQSSNLSNQNFLIGVDTDAKEQYDKYQEKFIISAIKEIKLKIKERLFNLNSYYYNDDNCDEKWCVDEKGEISKALINHGNENDLGYYKNDNFPDFDQVKWLPATGIFGFSEYNDKVKFIEILDENELWFKKIVKILNLSWEREIEKEKNLWDESYKYNWYFNQEKFEIKKYY